jgi:uncharacterized membrane protein
MNKRIIIPQKKQSKFLVSLYIIYLIYSVLVIICAINGPLTFGYGLGDIFSLFMICVSHIPILYLIFAKNKIRDKIIYFWNSIVAILIILIIVYWTLHLTLLRGGEFPWDGNIFLR